MVDRLVSQFREVVERLLPWYDPAEQVERAQRTERIHLRAIAVRREWERDLASYRRTKAQR